MISPDFGERWSSGAPEIGNMSKCSASVSVMAVCLPLMFNDGNYTHLFSLCNSGTIRLHVPEQHDQYELPEMS